MSPQAYQFIVCTPEQWEQVKLLGLNLGEPRMHPDGSKMITNKNGNLPLTGDEQDVLIGLGVEIVQSSEVQGYLEAGGWNE